MLHRGIGEKIVMDNMELGLIDQIIVPGVVAFLIGNLALLFIRKVVLKDLTQIRIDLAAVHINLPIPVAQLILPGNRFNQVAFSG